MKRLTSSRMAVGALGAVVVIAFTYITFAKGIPFTHGYQVEGVFSSSNQLRKGSPVRVAGVDVGKVVKLERGEGTTAEVTLEIRRSGLPVHRDATLKIRPRLFLEGGFFVEMEPGSPSAPELDDGGTIGLPQTAVPVQFHQVLTAFERPARASLRAILGELDTALDDGGAEALGRTSRPLAPTLRDLSIVGEAARGRRDGDVTDTIAATSRVTAALARRDDELGQLVGNLARTSGALARNDAALSSSLRELDATMVQAPPALRAIDRSLEPTEAFSADLRPSLGTAPKVLRDTPPFLRQVQGISRRAELPRTVDILEPTIDVLPGLQRRLRALLVLVEPVTDCVRDQATPVLKSSVSDGEFTTGRPVWQELLHTGVGLSSAGQTFDGNGHALRYNIGAGPSLVQTRLPGLGALQGLAEQPLGGARPLWLGSGRFPPFRPTARCADQPAVDLRARTQNPVAAAPTQARARRRTSTLTMPELERRLRETAGEENR